MFSLLLFIAIAYAQLPPLRIELDSGADARVRFTRHLEFDGRACVGRYEVVRPDGSRFDEEEDVAPAACAAVIKAAWMQVFLKRDCRERDPAATLRVLFGLFEIDESCACVYRSDYDSQMAGGMRSRSTIAVDPSSCESLYTAEQRSAWELTRDVLAAFSHGLP